MLRAVLTPAPIASLKVTSTVPPTFPPVSTSITVTFVVPCRTVTTTSPTHACVMFNWSITSPTVNESGTPTECVAALADPSPSGMDRLAVPV